MAFRFPTVYALVYAGVLIAVPLMITLVSLKSFSKEALVERPEGWNADEKQRMKHSIRE